MVETTPEHINEGAGGANLQPARGVFPNAIVSIFGAGVDVLTTAERMKCRAVGVGGRRRAKGGVSGWMQRNPQFSRENMVEA